MKLASPKQVIISFLLAFLSCFAVVSSHAEAKPNVVIVFVDDLGFGDLGCYGNEWIPTPHIDGLAKEGVRVDMSYVTNPPCSPSRACLMTGMYAQRFGKFGMARGQRIPDDHPTLAEFMRDAGYVTGQVGKWDLGSKDQGPEKRGFMEVAKWTEGKGKYFCTTPEGDSVYRTDLDGDRVVEFVERNKNKPFFLYFSPFAIHAPLNDTPKKYMSRIKGNRKETDKWYGGSVAAVDDQIGKLLTVLRKHDLDKKTLILLTGDNGPHYKKGGSSAPYRGGKGSDTQLEGWVHTPGIAWWPDMLPAGMRFTGMSCTLDYYATAAAVAGASLPKRCDGKNLLPYLKGEKQGDVHPTICWYNADPNDAERRRLSAVRWKNWRLLLDQQSRKWKLFDLHADPEERQDIAEKQPEVVDKMAAIHRAFVAQLPSLDAIPPYDNHWVTPPLGWGWKIGNGK